MPRNFKSNFFLNQAVFMRIGIKPTAKLTASHRLSAILGITVIEQNDLIAKLL